jgi:hypothetical protein
LGREGSEHAGLGARWSSLDTNHGGEGEGEVPAGRSLRIGL